MQGIGGALHAAGGVLGAPQRALEELETGGNVGRGLTHPEDQEKLGKAVRDKIGLTGAETTGLLAGDDLGHKLARGAVNFGLDVVNDPFTVTPVGWVGKAAKAIPGVEAALDATKASRYFNAAAVIEPYLTDRGKAMMQQMWSLGRRAGQHQEQADLGVIRQHADAIRAGQMPPAVAALFHRPVAGAGKTVSGATLVPAAKVGMLPRDVFAALAPIHQYTRGSEFRKGVDAALQANPHALVKPQHITQTLAGPQASDEALDATRKFGRYDPADNGVLRNLQTLTHLGNKAFLASPFPHVGNLMDLTYQKWGPVAVVKGLANATRIAKGGIDPSSNLGRNIAELNRIHGASAYGPIFDELGITRVAGIKGSEVAAQLVNKLALIPAQRFSNFLQDKVLNAAEEGLRSAALDAEKKIPGKNEEEIADSLHRGLGSDAPTKLVHDVSEIGQPFAQFRLQTVPGQGAQTLARTPGRVRNVGKAQNAYNEQFNSSGPQYQTAVPGQKVETDILADPLKYAENSAGPLGQLASYYSPGSEIERGAYDQVANDVAERFIPMGPEMFALVKSLLHQKGQHGENPLSDLIPDAILGGYWKRKNPGQ
jgi:hypothetical protein